MDGAVQIAIWAPAGPTIGGGHFARMRALAEALAERGAALQFLTNRDAPDALRRAAAAIPAVALTTIDGFPSPEMAAVAESAWVVIDDYAARADDEGRLRGPGRRILAIDDLADRPRDCDVLVDSMPFRCAADYRGLTPDGADICVGAQYAMVPRDILARRAARPPDQHDGRLRAILLAFGLSAGLAKHRLALSALALTSGRFEIVALVPDIASGTALLDEFPALADRVTLQPPISAPGELYAASDLAITTPSVTALELSALGVPLLLIEVPAEHTALDATLRALGAKLAAEGAAIRFTLRDAGAPAEIARALDHLAASPAHVRQMALAGAALVDGRGCERIADLLLSYGQ